MTVKDKILQGRTYLGIELGSTRIKAVLIDDSFSVIASGSKQWENRFENGCWTYSLDDIHEYCETSITQMLSYASLDSSFSREIP